MHYIDGLAFDEIAKVLNVGKSRVSQIHRASLSLLRKRLSKADPFRLQR